ncbi:acetolactate synthase 2 small subunit [Pasteurella multocida]|uniref:acetolactate synthase 2 small subunit n=1 Tax=Pasteurella multocida TaxID=747 RepID=UPI000DA4246A|nr:acetolactate synthase 2 small subunit [Pasteurella multocida]MDT8778958.1 acetolactate synthase 2 small subunit [Pasteurella multocida]SQI51940.1 IlvM [Pasteurella multocida]HDR1105225.1 acetolactate synthase 2 small subunit [Pasteurella multocida]
MQTYQFTLDVNQRPETLERILRVIRHRGFYVVAMNMTVQGEQANIDFTVKSDRAFALLTNQLSKVYDVLAIHQVRA